MGNKKIVEDLQPEQKIDDQNTLIDQSQQQVTAGQNSDALRKEILQTLQETTKLGGGKNSDDYEKMKEGILELEKLLEQPASSETAHEAWQQFQMVYNGIIMAAESYVKTHTTAFTHRGRVRRRTARALLNLCRNDIQVMSQSARILLEMDKTQGVTWREVLAEGGMKTTVQNLVAQKNIADTMAQISQSQEIGNLKMLCANAGFEMKEDVIMTVEQLEALLANEIQADGQVASFVEKYFLYLPGESSNENSPIMVDYVRREMNKALNHSVCEKYPKIRMICNLIKKQADAVEKRITKET